jgi:hypothetical protein
MVLDGVAGFSHGGQKLAHALGGVSRVSLDVAKRANLWASTDE